MIPGGARARAALGPPFFVVRSGPSAELGGRLPPYRGKDCRPGAVSSQLPRYGRERLVSQNSPFPDDHVVRPRLGRRDAAGTGRQRVADAVRPGRGDRLAVRPVVAAGVPAGSADTDGFDYDNDLTGFAEKITYLSPNWNGFQVGASFTPSMGDANSANPVGTGFNVDTVGDGNDEAYEVAARYEGVMSNFGYAIGAGYTEADQLEEWNAGLDLDSGPFGLGVVYTEGDNGASTRNNVDTWVVGADYTSGPFKFGASWLTQDDETAGAADLETDRVTGGVVYTAGPGLSFRGSISNIQHDFGATDGDATSVMGGVQINF